MPALHAMFFWIPFCRLHTTVSLTISVCTGIWYDCLIVNAGYLACARCSSTGSLVLVEPVATVSGSDQPLSPPRTERCSNCSGSGKVRYTSNITFIFISLDLLEIIKDRKEHTLRWAGSGIRVFSVLVRFTIMCDITNTRTTIILFWWLCACHRLSSSYFFCLLLWYLCR